MTRADEDSWWIYIKRIIQEVILDTLFCQKNHHIYTRIEGFVSPENRNSIQESKELKSIQRIPEVVNFDIEYTYVDECYTLIDLYERKFELGTITKEDFEKIQKKIFEEVLPRNLSHDLIGSNRILARKMNTWKLEVSKNDEEENPQSSIFSEEERLKNFQSLQECLKKTKPRPQKLTCEDKYIEDIDLSYKPKRTSSLKTPKDENDISEKKVVRFADALGLDLETFKQIFDSNKLPVLPISALSDLNLNKSKEYSSVGFKLFQLNFSQPCASINFYQLVLDNKIMLENANIDNSRSGSLFGIIRVKSVSFEKDVRIRITYNNWATFHDVKAVYVIESHDGVTDKFSFSLTFPETLVFGDKAEFAVTYQIPEGEKFWDNNNGMNYHIICYAKKKNPMDSNNYWINAY